MSQVGLWDGGARAPASALGSRGNRTRTTHVALTLRGRSVCLALWGAHTRDRMRQVSGLLPADKGGVWGVFYEEVFSRLASCRGRKNQPRNLRRMNLYYNEGLRGTRVRGTSGHFPGWLTSPRSPGGPGHRRLLRLSPPGLQDCRAVGAERGGRRRVLCVRGTRTAPLPAAWRTSCRGAEGGAGGDQQRVSLPQPLTTRLPSFQSRALA